MNLAYGGKADFRGNNNTLYNLFSYNDISVNTMIEHSDFLLKNATIHGSFFTQCHIIIKTPNHNFLNLSLWGIKIEQSNVIWANMTCADNYWKMGGNSKRICDNINIYTNYSSLHVFSETWIVHAYMNDVKNRIKGPKKRIDIHITPRKNDFCIPHGLIGQSYTCDKVPKFGETDEYPEKGEYTTISWAKGAIEGNPQNYEMKDIYDTKFKFDTFEKCRRC